MNWLKIILKRRKATQRFNPWELLSWPDDPVNGEQREGQASYPMEQICEDGEAMPISDELMHAPFKSPSDAENSED